MSTAAAAVNAMKERAANAAADLVEDGMVLGLGSGSTATLLVHALARRATAGLRFEGVPTSEATGSLAQSLGLKIFTLEERPKLDLAIDGADEVDPALNLIKGLGAPCSAKKWWRRRLPVLSSWSIQANWLTGWAIIPPFP